MIRGIAGILLAAGRSRRFGANKLIHPLADGTPMAVAAARHLIAVLPDTLAVVDAVDSEVAGLLRDEGLHVVVNPQALVGIGASIACGVDARHDAGGWVIALADMPFIPAGIIQQVVRRLEQGAEMVAPVYRGRRGHPVGFSGRHADNLLQLHTDEGARHIITAHRARLDLIEVQDKAVITDIDSINSPA